tara:strand:+ start:56188 stop:56322 length:135 start_codon:yes stop_codon:yes gene_type:complete
VIRVWLKKEKLQRFAEAFFIDLKTKKTNTFAIFRGLAQALKSTH